jgi:hypothetical protein
MLARAIGFDRQVVFAHTGLAQCLGTAAAGLAVAIAVPVGSFLPNVAIIALVSATVLAAFLAVVATADAGDLRTVMRRGFKALGRPSHGPPRVST